MKIDARKSTQMYGRGRCQSTIARELNKERPNFENLGMGVLVLRQGVAGLYWTRKPTHRQ